MRSARLAGQLRRRVSRPQPLRAKAPGQLRFMTYNTHHGAGRDGRHDIEAIARTIEGCQPDVVALQEVDRHWGERSAGLDQPAWYAERLEMFVHYAPNVVLERQEPGSIAAEYGLALLSRLPITESGHQLFTGPSAESRGLVTGLVSIPSSGDSRRKGDSPHKGDSRRNDGTESSQDAQSSNTARRSVRVINTHLSVRDPRARRREIAQLLSYADSEHDPPTVVAGDFNALTRARAVRAMRTTYRDAWDVGLGSPATVPGRRIDYLWMSRHFHPVQTVVVRSRASDHFALVSDLARD